MDWNNDTHRTSQSPRRDSAETKDKIEIEYSLNKDEYADLDIYDMLGSKVKTVKLYSGITKVTIEIGELANGVYLYSVRTNSGNQYFGKLIKE